MDAQHYHPPVKRSVTINGHQTSISLEPLFWAMLKQAAEQRRQPLHALVAEIDAARIRSITPPGLAGAIRLWLCAHLIDEMGNDLAPKMGMATHIFAKP